MDTEPPGSDNRTVVNGSSADQRFYLDRGSYQHLDPGDLRSVVPALLGVLCAVGLACNLSAMAALVSNARRGKLSLVNGLIFNLMLADGLVLAFSVPFRAAAYHRSSWTLGWPVCKTADWFFQSCMAAKSFTVAVMAKACYRYVSGPNKQVSLRPGSVLVVLLFTWLTAFSVTAPHLLFATLRRESRGLVCVMAPPPESRDFMWVYVKAYPLAVFCLPLSFAVLYFWKAYGRRRRRATKTQNLRTQIRSRKLTLMIFCLTAAMALLWLPHWVMWMWERHLAERERGEQVGSSPPLLLSLSAQLLTFSLSLVNPLVVLSLSEEFREGYWGLWRRFTLRKQPPPKAKPGPHNPTSLMSPHPRPETSGQQREDHPPQASATSVHGPNTESLRQPQAEEVEEEVEEEGCGGDGTEADETSLKDGVALPDVEQFWHEREAGSVTDDNDPVPWEHQGGGETVGKVGI
ncbi:G-protein coupled receptor 151 [Gadus macrocephalus]|uniref:G-protein coupled receptor 151 n=1 Tax=Gadus macrocephalus TaxID=80720 RepID=UPI0028CBBCC4|nr:G-protein coupled receptor 151 [Gadus macrocephalus]